jgi:Holliday junction resolvase
MKTDVIAGKSSVYYCIEINKNEEREEYFKRGQKYFILE